MERKNSIAQSDKSSIVSQSSDDSFYSITSTVSTKKPNIHKESAPLSSLLQQSYELAALKKDLREVRGLVAKTEVRVKALEEEFSNKKLDITVDRYLQRVEQVWTSDQKERKELDEYTKILEKLVSRNSFWARLKFWFSGFVTAFAILAVIQFLKRKL